VELVGGGEGKAVSEALEDTEGREERVSGKGRKEERKKGREGERESV